MNIKDFQGQSRFKCLAPIIYIVSWISMIFGPLYFPIIYNQLCMVLIAYLMFRSVVLCGLNVKLVLNTNKVLKKMQNNSLKKFLPLGQICEEIYHVFIIPSYKEDIELLQDTLTMLTQHKRSPCTYIVFLAMEKLEEGSHLKAQQLIKKFKGKFRHIDFTLHQIKQFQQKGKASNVSWCAQKMQAELKNLMVSEQNVFITIMDADSWAPQIYIDQLEEHIMSNYETRHNYIYQPPQIFTRNSSDVSIVLRTYDDMYSSMHASSLVSCSGISFSLSNYTLSYNLVKKVGFWDTVEQAIGQDMHMCLKSLWKTNGQITTVPIYAPFNQLNIQTGKGTFEDIKAKFWQIERHSRGVADIGYCINMTLNNQFNFKSFWATLSVMQAFFLPMVIPWAILSAVFQQNILYCFYAEPEGIISPTTLLFVFNLINIGAFVSNLIFEYFKRKTSRLIYGIQNPSWIRVFQGSFFYGVNLILITVPAFVIGAFGNMKSNRQYIVADKHAASSSTRLGRADTI